MPVLLGADPSQPRTVASVMDRVMRGQPYVKSALDMACWDLVGKRAGQPLCQALGGQFGDTVALYNAIPLDEPEAMAARARAFLADGYRRLQVKVGTDARVHVERLLAVRDAVGDSVVLFADANGGFTLAEARRFLRATRDVEYTIEQPCASYEECRALRHDCDRPLVLDESIESLADLLLSHRHGTADGITIKLSRVGGVTRAALIRDVAVELGVQVTVEDGGGASIDTAAIVQVSLSTPERMRLHTVDFNAWVSVENADGMPPREAGALGRPARPGLGVEVRQGALGAPIIDQS